VQDDLVAVVKDDRLLPGQLVRATMRQEQAGQRLQVPGGKQRMGAELGIARGGHAAFQCRVAPIGLAPMPLSFAVANVISNSAGIR